MQILNGTLKIVSILSTKQENREEASWFIVLLEYPEGKISIPIQLLVLERIMLRTLIELFKSSGSIINLLTYRPHFSLY